MAKSRCLRYREAFWEKIKSVRKKNLYTITKGQGDHVRNPLDSNKTYSYLFKPWQAQTGCVQRRISVTTNPPHPFSLFPQKIEYHVEAMDSEIQCVGHNFGKPGLKYCIVYYFIVSETLGGNYAYCM